jgi:hypothetical protein
MSTVFTLSGQDDPLLGLMAFRLKGEVTAGNTVVPILYNNFGFDNLLIALGQLIPPEYLFTINLGAEQLDVQLNNTAGDKVVFAHSMGAVVAARWLQEYAPSSDIPPDDLTFVLIGNPMRKYGGSLYPSSDITIPEDTDYSVRDIAAQYDAFADWPNLHNSPNYFIATTVAMAGWALVHPFYLDIPAYDTTMPTYTEGNIDYVFSPLRSWWIPEYVMDLVESAYDRPELDAASVPQLPTNSYANLGFRYPAGPVTPHGAYYILNDRIPQVALRAYDDSGVFNLMGGLAIPDRTRPERVEIKAMRGLISPWSMIDQKGATQDGVTFIDALYDPIDVGIDVVAHGRNPAHCRKVVNHLLASIDAKQEAELSFTTWEMGRWWTKLRWAQKPTQDLRAGKRQEIDLRLRADTGFWESYPNVEEFRFGYTDVSDTFSSDQSPWSDSDWTIAYSGAGTGTAYKQDGELRSTLKNRTMTARHDAQTATDFQVVEVQMGSIGQWFFPTTASIDIWVRMANTGTPGANGVRVRIANQLLTVSTFTAGVETLMRATILGIPPLPGEKFTVVAGTPDVDVPIPSGISPTLPESIEIIPEEPHMFMVMRNGAPLMLFKDDFTPTQIGSGFRSMGIGMHATSSTPPANITRFDGGDNILIEERSGFIERINAGDQEGWDRYTCFGPGTFRIGNGPGSTEMVEFGPLLPGQVMQIRTDPRKYGVKDLGSQPVTPQQQTVFHQLLQDFINFATGGNVPPLLQQIESWLGIVPPQGNPYRLLKGRFSNPIPAKPAGLPAKKYHIKAEIINGTAQSKIIAALTPLRRHPF